MHRWGILAMGLCVSGWLMSLLLSGGMEQDRAVSAVEVQPGPSLTLPQIVEGTQVMAVELASYEGPFWEDGSGEEVADVCALVIENIGGTMISRGQVKLQTQDGVLEFSFSWLPPGARALVPEQNRENMQDMLIHGCSGWCVTMYPEMTGAVTALEQGMDMLVFTNHTTQPIDRVEAVYKAYDPESGMYIGGVSHRVFLSELLPGEDRRVSAYRYASGYTKVVCILPQAAVQ